MPLEAIRTLVKEDLASTDQFIITQLDSHIPLIKQVIEYILTCGGKRIRPLVLLLSARALSPDTKKHIDLAAVIELIHTATLLHDDVVDNATLRRGHQTAHTIWGSNTSVLIGDFLYSRAFQIVVDLNHPTILAIFAKATHYIAEGEILQLINCHHPETREDFYFDIIQRKTAKLFEVATQLGALLSSKDDAHITAMQHYGHHLGLAYQLIDDALDYSPSSDQMGKNVGQDIADGKTTLPLIYAMRQCEEKKESKNLAILQNAIKKGASNQLETILGIIESTQAIQYTADAAKAHAQKANAALSVIPESPYRKAMATLSDFVVSRTY